MEECTNIALRKAREARKMPRWQLAQQIGVSADTIERWERGDGKPEPDDVDRIGEALRAPDLWHQWMLSNCDSYRKRYLGVETLALPVSVMRLRCAIEDALAVINPVERDVIDGQIDDKGLKNRCADALKILIAASADTAQKI